MRLTLAVTDGHNDLAILLRFGFNNHIYDDKFKKPFEEGGLLGHVDLPRLRKGQNGGAFWSVYVDCPKNGQDYSDANYAECSSHRSCSNTILSDMGGSRLT